MAANMADQNAKPVHSDGTWYSTIFEFVDYESSIKIQKFIMADAMADQTAKKMIELDGIR